jgi:hypothetical protein
MFICGGQRLGALGWGTAKTSAPTGRVFYVDPAHPPNWIPAGSTIIYQSPSTPAPTPPKVSAPTEQPRTPPPVQPELIPQYQVSNTGSGLQRPVEIPIEQTVQEKASETKAAESGSLLPIIIAIIAAIVAGN